MSDQSPKPIQVQIVHTWLKQIMGQQLVHSDYIWLGLGGI